MGGPKTQATPLHWYRVNGTGRIGYEVRREGTRVLLNFGYVGDEGWYEADQLTYIIAT